MIEEEITQLYGCKKIYGPYIGKDGRKRCVLYFEKGKAPSKAYSRLVVEASLGRLLSDTEEVDHINGDPTNDSIDNLQVLPTEEHRKKSGTENSIKQDKRVDWNCPSCGITFKVMRYRFDLTRNPCCSRSCSAKYAGANQYRKFGKRFSESIEPSLPPNKSGE